SLGELGKIKQFSDFSSLIPIKLHSAEWLLIPITLLFQSPVSILADDPPVENHQPTNCVDLSFLEEALLASPPQDSSEDGEKEACDILQQSLQEADITEQTLAEEAGLAAGAIGSQPADIVPLYVTSDGQHADLGTLLQPPSHALPKALTVHPMVSGLGGVQLTGLQNVPKDTQAAVEPPQPSLMAVGPGCPSLIGKPTPPQLMSLLPGTVFPAPTSEQPLALNPAHGSSVLIQKTVPNVSGSSLFSSTPISHAIRANMGSSLLIPRAPLPIQPKLPVSIQPRLVQISPKPISTTVSPNQQHRHPAGVTFVSGNPHQNFLLSAAHNNVVKQQSSQGLAKPVSLQLLNQTSSIVIQPQGIFPTPNQFILPGHLATTSSPSISQAPSARSFLPNQSSSTQPLPVVRHSTSGPLVDTTQLLATPSGQLNFGQVFTTPNGQFAVRQGAILSGPFQFQTSAPTIFQMPTQLTSSFSTQSSGPQNGNTVQPTQTLLPGTTSLGNQITVLNSSGVLGPALSIQPGPGASIPDLASVSIMNGQPVVHGVQSTTFPAQNQPSASLLPSEGSTGFQPLHQINKDHTTVMNPDCSTPFHSVEDAIVHLLPYHTFVGRLPTKDDFSVVDEQFETVSSQLLKRTQEMLNKYRQLMLQEIQQVKQSAEMVMLERLFLHDERVELREVQKVRRLTSGMSEPGYGPVASNYKPVSYVSPANQPTIPPDTDLPLCVTPNLAPIDPPCSSPPLRLMFDCTKSLRTYPSRKRGGLKLTIKQEAGYSKVVRNSVCEPWAVSSPASTARSELEPINMDNVNGNSKKEQTWDSLDFREAIQRLPAPLEHQQSIFSKATGCGENTTAMNGAHFSFLENKSKQSAENGEGIVTKSLQSGTTVNHQEEGLCPSFRQNFGEVDERCLETGMPAPYAKRPRSEPSPGQEERRCKSPQADSVLSEHLQSAIDSILLLQKLQGQSVSETPSLGLFEPPSLQNVPECGLGTGEPSALEEAVKSILEDKM
uniref:GLTSCR protein conserved domain-containing protein n=1 Tax=Erpetoichthys calabaricus TaxID=27687 RepID=A0A8C4T6J3_ERPCA